MSTTDFRRRRPQPSQAYFTNSYLLKSGVIIADNNFAVKPAMDKSVPGWETNSMITVTHLRRVSRAPSPFRLFHFLQQLTLDLSGVTRHGFNG
jgi:hypothetical protein